MSKNICKECGTENESEYAYCKNCGTKLESSVNKPSNDSTFNNSHEFIDANKDIYDNSYVPNNNYQYTQSSYNHDHNDSSSDNYANYNRYKSGFYNVSIDGIPSDEMVLFVGKKAYEIMPKFTKMELTHSKISWCWPAAILGFIFGPLGSAVWFFYRKMYKTALLLLAVGILVTGIVTAMTFNTNSTAFDSVINALETNGIKGFANALDSVDIKETAMDFAAKGIENTVNIATCILCGLFGYSIYKKHCVESIRNFRTVTSDQRYYKLGLAAIGGVSGGMLAVGIVAIIFVNNISSLLTFILR